MQLNEARYGDLRPIDSYGPGFFRIGGVIWQGATWVTGTRAGAWGGPGDAETLMALAGEVDVILLGTGAEIAHVPADLSRALESAGVGVEPMATPQACRSFNVLLSEGRRVGAALVAL